MRQFVAKAALLGMLMGLSSCTGLLLSTMGMHKPVGLNDGQVMKYARKYDIPLDRIYRADSALFDRELGADKLTQALLQPAQLRVYGPGDTLVAIVANCHVGGFPNLKWERSDWTSRFPPYSAVAMDSTVLLSDDARWWHALNESPTITSEANRPTVVLVWSRFMGRQTKRLVEYSEELARTWPQANWYYVNVDDLFSGAEF